MRENVPFLDVWRTFFFQTLIDGSDRREMGKIAERCKAKVFIQTVSCKDKNQAYSVSTGLSVFPLD